MPKKPKHTTVTKKCQRTIERLLPPGWHVRKEDPVQLPIYDEPEPDVSVVRGDEDAYLHRHPGPGDVTLIIEVAETSLTRNRGEKRDIYARAGIPTYWVVNLVDRQLEVYSNPAGGVYPAPTILGEHDSADLVIEGRVVGQVAVAEILPPP
jgi:Uma2 family endonuclease